MRKPAEPAPKPVGSYVRASHKDGPQVVRSRGKRWSDKAAEVFLNHLATTCNVAASAEAAGYRAHALYTRRRTDPTFAARWRAALDQGYVRIETLLIENACNALAGTAPDPDAPIPPMTAREAMHLLMLHRSSIKGGPHQKFDSRRRPRTLDDVRDSILGKLARIERAQARATAQCGKPTGADAPG